MRFLGGISGTSKEKRYIVSYFWSPVEHRNAYYKAYHQSFQIVSAANAKEAKAKVLENAKAELGDGDFTRVVVNRWKK